MRQIYIGKNKKKNHGCCVYHDTSLIQRKDGDTTNCVLDNLYLISRAAQVRKNWDDLPDERKAACRAKIQERRNKSIRADRLRLKWGLEPLGGLVKRVR